MITVYGHVDPRIHALGADRRLRDCGWRLVAGVPRPIAGWIDFCLYQIRSSMPRADRVVLQVLRGGDDTTGYRTAVGQTAACAGGRQVYHGGNSGLGVVDGAQYTVEYAYE